MIYEVGTVVVTAYDMQSMMVTKVLILIKKLYNSLSDYTSMGRAL